MARGEDGELAVRAGEGEVEVGIERGDVETQEGVQDVLLFKGVVRCGGCRGEIARRGDGLGVCCGRGGGMRGGLGHLGDLSRCWLGCWLSCCPSRWIRSSRAEQTEGQRGVGKSDVVIKGRVEVVLLV